MEQASLTLQVSQATVNALGSAFATYAPGYVDQNTTFGTGTPPCGAAPQPSQVGMTHIKVNLTGCQVARTDQDSPVNLICYTAMALQQSPTPDAAHQQCYASSIGPPVLFFNGRMMRMQASWTTSSTSTRAALATTSRATPRPSSRPQSATCSRSLRRGPVARPLPREYNSG